MTHTWRWDANDNCYTFNYVTPVNCEVWGLVVERSGAWEWKVDNIGMFDVYTYGKAATREEAMHEAEQAILKLSQEIIEHMHKLQDFTRKLIVERTMQV